VVQKPKSSGGKTMSKVFTVSEAARELRRSERWLRDAERTGKIPRARRDLNNWRVYTEEDIAALHELLSGSASFQRNAG
jgi:DNA-binding transcriptional MerR regulator